jgi:Asp-tRNA(Asn)/Glu-tRNA(Gln) amidotransferase A subunit family amidase
MCLKDIFRLEGVKLTMMSRPWIELYGPDEESADYSKKLISLGAVIVGKTKMTSFASPEEPTDQWIDFHCPVNPRGDMYQSPASSSTGAGVALAGYPWLDYSVAGDCMLSLFMLMPRADYQSSCWKRTSSGAM